LVPPEHYSDTHCPQTFKQAYYSGEWEHWQAAIKEELARVENYKVWEVVEKEPHMRGLE
jgi:hypothetical protein